MQPDFSSRIVLAMLSAKLKIMLLKFIKGGASIVVCIILVIETFCLLSKLVQTSVCQIFFFHIVIKSVINKFSSSY